MPKENITCKKCGHNNEIRNTATLDHYICDDCGSRQNTSFVHKDGQFVNESSGPIPMDNDNNDNGLPF